MCNGKGWDLASDGSDYWPEAHSCRVWGDCGHVDNSFESITESVIKGFDTLIGYLYYRVEMGNELDTEEETRLLGEQNLWKTKTHQTYLYYAKEELSE